MENVSNTERLFLANEVRLRAEHFGALVFDRRDGTILEVDRQGFGLLLRRGRLAYVWMIRYLRKLKIPSASLTVCGIFASWKKAVGVLIPLMNWNL